MPTKPQIKKLEANSAQILNAIRNDLGGSYAAQVPPAVVPGQTMPDGSKATLADSVASLRQIGKAMFTFQANQNAFLDQLVNRIGRVIISSRLYENPWAVFKKGYLEYGETVEEIFVNITNAAQFDPETAENEVFKREIPDVNTAFHSMNYQKFYKVTVSEQQLRTAFLSFEGVTDLITKIIETLYTSANYDEFLMMKYLCAVSILNGQTAVETIPTATLTNADEIMSNLRALSLNLQYMDTQYNYAGVTTYSDPRYQYIIMSNAFASVVDVGSLARAFNLEYVDFIGHTVGINNFTFSPEERVRLNRLINMDPNTPIFTDAQYELLATVAAMVVDENWFMIFDNLEEMRQQPNEQGLYWNHFYHVWKTFSVSPFNNAVTLTTTTPTVTGVTVTPSTVAKGTIPTTGGTVQLTATVTGTGIISQDVVWSSSNMDLAVVNSTGLVTVKPGTWVTGTTVTITAASRDNLAKTGTCTITLA